jgi:hypothetical protein
MTARELFAVLVRGFGLILLTIGLIQVVQVAIDLLQPDVVNTAVGFDLGYPHRSAMRNLSQSIALIVPGATFLFGTRWIVRLFYNPQP